MKGISHGDGKVYAMKKTPWFVYILQSATYPKLYTGATNDPAERLRRHNNGSGAKFTRTGRPWQIVYLEQLDTKSDALRREAAIKRLGKDAKYKLILEYLKGFSSPSYDILVTSTEER